MSLTAALKALRARARRAGPAVLAGAALLGPLLGPRAASAQPGPGPSAAPEKPDAPSIVTGGAPPLSAGGRKPGDSGEDPQTEAIRAVMDCVMFARRNRYYPFRARVEYVRRDPATGRWDTAQPRYLDPIARWDDARMTFVTLTEAVGPDGGIDLAGRPHAVLAIPLAALQAAPAAEPQDFNVSFLVRSGPETQHTSVPVRLKRSKSFNYRYESRRPVEAFTTPADNPRALRLTFEVYFTWDCEQDFREAIKVGMTRDEVIQKAQQEMLAWKKLMQEQGTEKAPGGPMERPLAPMAVPGPAGLPLPGPPRPP